ncbi:MAG: GerMN domain-containing protein [Actinomycetota bacterium]|nr:GerMN domain-containing protein [Actinomycetota bacterium]
MKLAVVLVAALAVGCGGGDRDTVTIYLRARLGPDGPHGQRAAILTPVERDRRTTISRVRQAVLELLVGPSQDERTRGFHDTIPLATRLLGVTVHGDRARVELAGAEPDLYGAAAIVYSVAGAADVDRVQLRLDGAPCCVRTHRGDAIPWLSPASFRFWQGEPCRFRTSPTHVRCRG